MAFFDICHRIGGLLPYARQHMHRWRTRKRKISVVFRYDDYSAKSSTETERTIIDCFRSNEAALTFGVIPFVCAGDVHDPTPQASVPLPDEKADILRKASASGTLDIALHGYSHQTTRADEMMEFSGVGYQTQLEKIAAGRKFLEEITGAPISSFVPPWNRYDKGTLRALQDHGFSTLSAGQQGDAPSDIPLKFLPATCDLLRVREAVRIARDAAVAEPVIVVLFHDYDFSEVNAARGKSNYQSLFDLLRWLRQQRDVRLLSISEATRVIGDLSINRFLFCQSKPACVY